MKKNILSLSILSLGLLLGTQVFAQAVETLNLNLEKIQKATINGDQQTTLDLMAEAKRQSPAIAALPSFELVKVDVTLRSGAGGADAHLVVNNLHVDSQSVETDGSDAKIQLKNSERRVDSAVLMVIGIANIRSVAVTLGSITETAMLGTYANRDANAVAQATPDAGVMIRPTDEVKSRSQGSIAFQPSGTQAVKPTEQKPPCTILGMPCPRINIGGEEAPPPQPPRPVPVPKTNPPQVQPAPRTQPPLWIEPTPQAQNDDEVDTEDPWKNQRVVTRPPAPMRERNPVVRPRDQDLTLIPPPAAPVNPNCVGGFCVGNRVKNSFGIEGRVIRAFPDQGRLAVKFPYSDQILMRTPSELRRP